LKSLRELGEEVDVGPQTTGIISRLPQEPIVTLILKHGIYKSMMNIEKVVLVGT
jgi:hypothetical protein